nr:Myo-inositol 2-dehydrogenase [Verruciconidia persicina]
MSNLPRLKFALLGLGRLGVIRAQILAFQQPLIELVAVCDTKPGTEKWAAQNLPPSVRHFTDPAECLKHSGAEAILICLHVMCEKPISVDVITTAAVIEKVSSRPDLKFLVPFTRRYDKSYREAKALIKSGELGEVHAVETFMSDVQDPAGNFVAFAAHSGGIFLDMGIHHDSTRICGSQAHSIVSGVSNVEIRDKHGVRKRTVPDAFQLFPETFLADITEFANAVIFDKPLTCQAEDAFEAGKICTALQHSFRPGLPVYFDDDGFPILDAIKNGH